MASKASRVGVKAFWRQLSTATPILARLGSTLALSGGGMKPAYPAFNSFSRWMISVASRR